MEKIDIKSYNLDQLKDFVTEELNEKTFRAQQIFEWLHQKNVTSFAEMKNLSHSLRQALEKRAHNQIVTPVTRREAADGTIKYLFRLKDQETIESVYLPYADGRKSICISSQVGCAMGCSFCATGLGGLARNLLPSEIIDQVYAVQRDLGVEITNVVLMGMGEPLVNYENVLRAIRLLNHARGANIGIRRITLSTCGIIPGIRRLAKEEMQLVLAISLHAPNNNLRNQLMPINKKYPIEDLIQACREYIKKTHRRISFEYALMAGVNDQKEHAQELATLLQGLLCHVNLIPINPVAGTTYHRSKRDEIVQFQKLLQDRGIEVTVREERGTDIEAACGQLRSQNRR